MVEGLTLEVSAVVLPAKAAFIWIVGRKPVQPQPSKTNAPAGV
jgi:hypothetical protein